MKTFHFIAATAAFNAPTKVWGYYTVTAETKADARAAALRDFLREVRGRWVVINEDAYGPRDAEEMARYLDGHERQVARTLTAQGADDAALRAAEKAGTVVREYVNRGMQVGFTSVEEPVWRWPKAEAA